MECMTYFLDVKRISFRFSFFMSVISFGYVMAIALTACEGACFENDLNVNSLNCTELLNHTASDDIISNDEYNKTTPNLSFDLTPRVRSTTPSTDFEQASGYASDGEVRTGQDRNSSWTANEGNVTNNKGIGNNKTDNGNNNDNNNSINKDKKRSKGQPLTYLLLGLFLPLSVALFFGILIILTVKLCVWLEHRHNSCLLKCLDCCNNYCCASHPHYMPPQNYGDEGYMLQSIAINP